MPTSIRDSLRRFCGRSRWAVEIFWFWGALTQHDVLLTMNGEPRQEKRLWKRTLLMVLRRLAFLVALGFAIGWVLNHAEAALEKRREPAGFFRGVVQGALMPLTMPNLIFGHDVAIYAANNTGRNYKIGYTLGVNTCGLIFFGFFFWRVRRMKLRLIRATSPAETRPQSTQSEYSEKV